MKVLFLVDGAYGAAKKALCDILNDEGLYRWCLIKKLTTKEKDKLPSDMKRIDKNTAEEYMRIYSEADPSNRYKTCRYFCYHYPRLEKHDNEEINCIDTQEIDDACRTGNDYGFLIVRSHRCMMDIIKRYEKNGQLAVVPVFIYTDDHYISGMDEITKRKSKKLFDDFINDREGRERINFEDVLIYKSEIDGTNPRDILLQQLKQLISRISDKNERMFVVTDHEKYYLPDRIVPYKVHLQQALRSDVETFGKSMFMIMPFDERYNEYYETIKNTCEQYDCKCIRADDKNYTDLCQNAGPDIAYWLKMYMCKFGIALFDSDRNNKLIINPNVVYEMGIMKQQGKDICILRPKGSKMAKDRDAEFFDIKNEWKYEYEKDNYASVESCISQFIMKHKSV